LRAGILVLGIILLILGIFLFFQGTNKVSTGNYMMSEIDKYNEYGLPLADLLKIVSPEAQSVYYTGLGLVQEGQRLIMFGSIFGIVGFIVCIAGLVAPSKKGQYKTESSAPSPPQIIIREEPKETLKPDRRCPGCGRIIPDASVLCPFCGKKFTTNFIEEQSDETKRKEPAKENDVEIVEPATNKTEIKQKILKSQYCPECGQKLKGLPKFCSNCGAKQEEN
jgi:uncharacterized membrane protein